MSRSIAAHCFPLFAPLSADFRRLMRTWHCGWLKFAWLWSAFERWINSRVCPGKFVQRPKVDNYTDHTPCSDFYVCGYEKGWTFLFRNI